MSSLPFYKRTGSCCPLVSKPLPDWQNSRQVGEGIQSRDLSQVTVMDLSLIDVVIEKSELVKCSVLSLVRIIVEQMKALGRPERNKSLPEAKL